MIHIKTLKKIIQEKIGIKRTLKGLKVFVHYRQVYPKTRFSLLCTSNPIWIHVWYI